MTFLKKLPKTSKGWYDFITQKSTDRCDLDILLKDEWRHKIVVRDDANSLYDVNASSILIEGSRYTRLKEFLSDRKMISILPLAVTAWNMVLGSYGHGSQTVIAVLDIEKHDWYNSKILPVFFDHTKYETDSCSSILEVVENMLYQNDAFVDQDSWLRNSIFDAALATIDFDYDSTSSRKQAFPLTILFFDGPGYLKCTLIYASKLFEEKVILGLLEVLREMLFQLVLFPYKLIKNLDLISEEQKQQLIKWNSTDGNFPEELRLNALIDLSIKKKPDAEAVKFNDQSIYYGQLGAYIDQLTAWLLDPKVHIQPNTLIALYLEKNISVILAILGIWKAGAAFVPIDINYPIDRVRFILKDSGVRYVITSSNHSKQLHKITNSDKSNILIIDIDRVLQKFQKEIKFEDKISDLRLDSNGLAYVTYTSGTTGLPKGVPKFHRNVVNSITDLSDKYDMLLPGTERVALFSSYVFEPFIRQMLIALINSQTLVIVPDNIRSDPSCFSNFLKQNKITYLNGTGSVLQHYDLKDTPSLKRLLLVGEELTTALLRQLRKGFNGEIINEYSFTEAAFVTTIKKFTPDQSERVDRSIGRPVRNVKCYVLSESLKQVPIGAIGELYIGGIGVAYGYLNREELTKKCFLDNTFQTEEERYLGKNEHIYKTGDLARFLHNGELEYMGRCDFQLKLSGVRVEPGEIEANVMEFPGVKKCVVVAYEKDDETKYLIGYFVSDNNEKIYESDLITHLEKRLIRVMVPTRMIQLEHIPVNINGKVDRGALPKIQSLTQLKSCSKPLTGEQNNVNLKVYLIDALKNIWSKVLKIPFDQISVQDDFFRLGGQSITCILLVAAVRNQLGLILDTESIFKLRTLTNITNYLAQQGQSVQQPKKVPLSVDSIEQSVVLPANGLHQGLLYHTLKNKVLDDAYVMQSVYRYHVQLDIHCLKKAWEYALRKYPGLRLSFEWESDPLQIINSKVELIWYFEDLSQLESIQIQENHITELRIHDRKQPYNLAKAPLFRIYLIKQRIDLFALIFSCHHIILDGWSLSTLHDEVHRIYLFLMECKALDLKEDTAYVATQRHWEAHVNDSNAYWVSQIERIEDRCDLTGLLNQKSRYKVDLTSYDQILEHKEKKLSLGIEQTTMLKSICSNHQLTLHSVLQFVWHKILHAIGGGQHTVVGTIVSGRNLPIESIEESVGLFINTLPLIVDHKEQQGSTAAEAITNIQSAVHAMDNHSIVVLGALQNGIMKRSLFDTLLVLENYPETLDVEEESYHKKNLYFEHVFDIDKVDYPLAVVAREENNALAINIWYAGELFDDTTVDMLLDTAETLFEQLAIDLLIPVDQLKICSSKTLACLDAWNNTIVPFDQDITLHGIFQQVVSRWSDSVAVVFREQQIAYIDLDHQANQIAHQLLAIYPLQPNNLVVLVLDKSEKMIATILAVWKAGAAYVPIDAKFPDERIAFILKDTQARIIVTHTSYSQRISLLAKDRQQIMEIEKLDLVNQPCTTPITSVTSTDLAYAIYTSGTTGNPKAVLVEHRGVVNLQLSLSQIFSLRREQGNESMLSFSNYVFDHFIEQMIDALLNGQKLVVLDDQMREDQDWLLTYMNKHEVTYLSGTPSVLSIYDFSQAQYLKRIDAIGEDFTTPVFNKIRHTFKGIIINGYGPTEVSITTHKRIYGPNELRLNKSIGYPVANTMCYVLNKSMQLVPIGGIGELYIGGIGVARGYLNQPNLTAERFLKNPFETSQQARMGINSRIYQTGDLVRWLPNGELEYLGRDDFQVKIRGHRVELGEVEAALTSHPNIERSFVIVRDHQSKDNTLTPQKYLVGFYLSDHEIEEEVLKKWMRAKISDAIVPTRIIRIDRIPVTASGKIDIKKLPDTEFVSSTSYIAPNNSIEIKLSKVWSKVLDIPADSISVHDDFFGLGGDSIRSILLAQTIKNSFKQHFPVSSIFENATISDQAKYIQKYLNSKLIGSPTEEVDRSWEKAFIPLSFAQQRLMFIDDFQEGSIAYNIPFCLEIDLQTDTLQETLKGSLQTLLCRHSALRTLLEQTKDGQYIQHVLDSKTALNLFHITEGIVKSHTELDEVLVSGERYLFRLGKELPIQIGLFQCLDKPRKIYLHIVVHHSCFDGWSWDIFKRELVMLATGTPVNKLKKLQAAYTDFTLWQRKQLSEGRLLKLSKFWKSFLEGSEPAQLPQDFLRPAQFDYRGREIEFHIDRGTTSSLKEFAKSNRVSLYTVLLGSFSLVIKVFNGQHDFILGTPYANRSEPEFDGIIGFFANLLALRIKVDPWITLQTYIQSVGRSITQAQVHNEMPFEEIIRCLKVDNDPSRNPIIQIIFTIEDNTTLDKRLSIDQQLSMRPYKPQNDGWTTTKFDATITLSEVHNGLIGNFTYAASLFEADSVQQFINSFLHILNEFIRLLPYQATARLTDMYWVDLEQQALLKKVEPSNQACTTTQLVNHIFEQIVAQQPDSIALVYKNIKLSYSELDRLANQMANYLLSTVSLRPNDLVALVLDKSERMIISIFAVWKAGAAYLPIDPNYPDKRIAFMLEDTQASIVLTDKTHSLKIRSLANASLSILEIEKLDLHNQLSTPPFTSTKISDLAYAIYTSGTTGKPKAVLVEHRNLISFLYSAQNHYFKPNITEQESILFLSNYVFDFSIEQIVLSLLSGNRLLIPADGLPLFDHVFYDLMNNECLTYLSGTPTQIHQIDLSRIKCLRTVVVAGELFQIHHFNKIIRTFSGRLYNAYGTTESTIYNIVNHFNINEPYCNTLGKPLLNTTVYLLDQALKYLPNGAIGELYLAGPCIARGYLNQPHLTNERFIPNPYYTQGNNGFDVLYKTGDLVRKRSDGIISYIGRNDSQVKIKGIRIELGEIEAILAEYPTIEQCAVVAQTVNDKESENFQLIGYVVTKEGATLELDKVFYFLGKRLMSSMIPSRLIPVSGSLPMTANGKLDTRALPGPSFMHNSYTAPRNRMDAVLCDIWRTQLNNDAIGISDNFFRSGGDSIKAMMLASKIQQVLRKTIRIKDLFDFPSVREFVDHVLNDTTNLYSGYSLDTIDPPTGVCPMLPIQKWFFTLPLEYPAYWNQHFAIRTAPLDVNQLYTALVRLTNYHDVFRLRYRIENLAGSIKQYYNTNLEKFELFTLNVSNLNHKEIQEELQRWQSDFDLEKGPIWCAAYLDGFHDGSARIWIAMHHLIVDVVSWQILARDLEILYHGGDLGAPACHYVNWVKAIDNYTPTKEEIQLWGDMEAAVRADTGFIYQLTDNSYYERCELNTRTTQALLVDAHQAYDTHINDLLLTAVGLALRSITNRNINCLMLESHGRPFLEDVLEVRDSVGWFTAMYPIAIEAYDDLSDSIRSVKDILSRIPNQGIGYGALRGTYRSESCPLPSISFNYLGQLSNNRSLKIITPPKAWSLDTSMCGSNKGKNNKDTNQFVLDITIYISEGRMVIEIDSRLKCKVTRKLSSELKASIEKLVNHTLMVRKARDDISWKHQFQETFEPYILVNEHKQNPTLFIFPPGEGGAESYLNNIAKQLSDVRLVLFNNIHLVQPMESFELLGTYYMDYIKQLQPVGPYHLLGWSFGGVLAFEIALQLTKSDLKVKNLTLIDSYFDVRYASEHIGLYGIDDILDPINYYYTPSREDVNKLSAYTPHVLLFKASKLNNVFHNKNQQSLFKYYKEAPFNNLDRIFPEKLIIVEIFDNDTHHSWVHNKEQVIEISHLLRKNIIT